MNFVIIEVLLFRKVSKQFELSDKPYLHDYADFAIANKRAVNMCCKCENTYKKELNICPSCNNNENMHDIEFDPYYCTVHNHPKDPTKIVIGKPVMVMPWLWLFHLYMPLIYKTII